VLLLNAAAVTPNAKAYKKDDISQFWEAFDSGVKNQLINVHRFQEQEPKKGKVGTPDIDVNQKPEPKKGKVLIYTSTNGIHFSYVPPYYASSGPSRMAMTRVLQELANHVPASEMRILTVHPGLTFTDASVEHGNNENSLPYSLPYDNINLPGNFFVWAATDEAEFLHGRFVWANWDVDELIGMKDKIEKDLGFLRVGLQGIASESFKTLFEGMKRSI